MSQTFEREVIDRLARIEEGVAGLYDTKKDHEERLRAVEKENRLQRGAFVILTAVLGWLGVHVPLH